MLKRKNSKAFAFFEDMIMIAIGIVIAIMLSRIGFIDYVVQLFSDYYIIASFVTGIFFTSAFTLAPSSIALVHIAENFPIHSVAIWGGLGAMCGDLILFFFIRDRFARDVSRFMKPFIKKRFTNSLHLGFLKYLSPILGALIIASPLPDEFGLTLMGLSKVRVMVLMPIAFVMNVIGIYFLIIFSHLL